MIDVTSRTEQARAIPSDIIDSDLILSYYASTVEPPIMDTPKEDKPLYKGHSSWHQINISLHAVPNNLNLPEEDKLSTKDKVASLKVPFIPMFHCIQ